MNELLSQFGRLPKVVQALMLLVAGGGAVGAFQLMGWQNALATIVFGGALVGLMLLGYSQWLRFQSGRRASPMEQAIRGNAGAAPIGIAEPARRARLDDLRASFEKGVQKFRDAGKNLYALPWYVLVGESGSGKTEAIRHCNVGFPPGLQDQLQGAGGTLNMNWWFTNHAVILDTAGRLMFEEVKPGTTNEWHEFLKLLRRARPNCPVNGMLLVIPADSLIRDSAEAIEKKAGRIAEQLDSIQRSLGVRFPVYVVVTKCDKINGFREFFDGIADPGLQHQMMGWSNPAPLDTPFDPEQIDQHLRTVATRLQRRRLALLQDPVHTEDPRARRIEQVDALFEFPDAFMDIAPRLKRYLQMVFVAGEWSAKPLFLRGIYFTSSMREGEELDAKLAAALRIPIENLAGGGKVWDRERAYFLRDLFMGKVFKEKGLVTRASDTRAQQRKRRNVLYGTSAVGVLALAAITYLGMRDLGRNIQEPATFWRGLDQAISRWAQTTGGAAALKTGPVFPIVTYNKDSGQHNYRGGAGNLDAADLLNPLPIPGEDKRFGAMPIVMREQSGRVIRVPMAYVPMARVMGDNFSDMATSERREAVRAYCIRSVVQPLVSLTAEDFRRRREAAPGEPVVNTERGVAALAQLLRLEVMLAGAQSQPADKRIPSGIELRPLADYLLGERGAAGSATDLADALADLERFQPMAAWLFDPAASTADKLTLPLRPDEVAFRPSVSELTQWAESLTRIDSESGGGYRRVNELLTIVAECGAREAALHELGAPDQSTRPWKDWIEDWNRRREALAEVASRLTPAIESEADPEIKRLAGSGELVAAFDRVLREQQRTQEVRLRRLLDELSPLERVASESGSTDVAGSLGGLRDLRRALDQAVAAQQPGREGDAVRQRREQAAQLGPAILRDRGLERRLELYAAAQTRLSQPLAWTPQTTERGKPGEQLLNMLTPSPASASEAVAGGESGDGTRRLLQQADRVADRRTAVALVRLVNQLRPGAGGRLSDQVAVLAARPEATGLKLATLPMTDDAARIDPRFAPAAAAACLRDIYAAASVAADTRLLVGEDLAATDRDDLRALANDARTYLRELATYWTTDLISPRGLYNVRVESWQQFRGSCQNAEDLRARLTGAVEMLEQAAASIGTLKSCPAVAADRESDAAVAQVVDWAARSRAALNAEWRSAERVMGSFAGLGDEPVTAAGKLRSENARECWLEKCFSLGESRCLLTPYMQSVFGEGLMRLAAESGVRTAADVRELTTTFSKFPLVRWSSEAGDLSEAEVASARKMLERLLPDSAAASGGVICDNLRGPTPELVSALKELFSGGPLTAERDRLQEMKRRAEMLNADRAGRGVDVLLLSTQGLTPTGAWLADTNRYIRLDGAAVQGGACRGTREVSATGELLGTIPLRSGEVAVAGFARDANCAAAPDVRLGLPSRWVPIYLLDLSGGRSASGAFDVIVPLDDGKRSIPLRVRFPS